MRRRSITFGLVLLAYALALVQRPGEVVADTKVDLYVAPARFLSNVLSVWSPTTDLGHVFGAQYSGYAWPMAPWFAFGDAIDVPTWIVHRLWLGTLLALAAVGIVRLLDALATPRRGALHVAAGVLFIVNPYVTVYANRTSISLLSYAALPWLLLAIHRGLREPRGWRWPALFALVLASTGGGVNVAVTAWLLVGPALLVIYEMLWGGVAWRAARGVVVRLIAVNVVAQVWWIVPVLIQGMAAPSFLPFSEQPGTIWSTTSIPESLRLMGFWTSYVGVGFGGVLRPFQGSAPALLFLLPVVLAGLAVPALSLSGFVVTRRWRYAPFFLLLTLAGVLIMSVGWPAGTPLRRAATGAYYHVQSIEFLRTTYKAGALVALGLAALGGAAFDAAWQRVGARVPWRRMAVAGAAAGAVVFAAWPLVSGRALERQLAFDLPPAWRSVAADLDRRPTSSRAMELPGQLFAYASWGGTIDPILPALTDHPVTTRWIVPFSDRRATELQWTVDGLITQERLKPGQLPSLLDLLGVGDLVVAADGDRGRSGEAPVGDVIRDLRDQGVLTAGTRRYGPTVVGPSGAGHLTRGLRVPEITRSELRTGGIVRVLPQAGPVIVDGGAGGIAALAAFGVLDPDRALSYAPDLGAAGIRAAARPGATVVISDANRRRAFLASRSRGQVGPTLPVGEGISADGAILDPWLGAPAFETVQQLAGVASVTAPASPQVTQFPERRPFAAVDGDPSTAWLADRALERPRHRLTVTFDAPRDVPAIDLMPYSDSRGRVEEVVVAGRRFRVHRGWNHLTLGLHRARSLTVILKKVSEPEDGSGAAGGIRELRIPGVTVHEALRPPVLAETALRGRDLSGVGLDYLLERTTADVPQLASRYVGERGAGLLRDAQDPERQLSRTVDPPVARRYAVDAWATIAPRTADDVLDGLARGRAVARGAVSATSSSRFDGLARHRASGVFDGGDRAWIGQWIPGRPAWLAWKTPVARTVTRLVLMPAAVRVRRPTRVRLTVDGHAAVPVRVGPLGLVTLPRAVRGRHFRLDVLDARFPTGTSGRDRQRRAVGIGEITGAGVPALRAPRSGTVALPCGVAAVRVGGRAVGLGGTVDRAALEAGRPLRLHGCGPVPSLPARRVSIIGVDRPLRVDALWLASVSASATMPAATGRVLDSGTSSADARRGARIAVDAPSWLVFGESYDRHWRATCDGRDLGTPRPMQGYANAWPVTRGCGTVDFTYNLQRAATAGYVISLVACVLLLLVALVGFRRRTAGAVTDDEAGPQPLRLPPTDARGHLSLLPALTAVVVIGLAFGLRAGAVAAVAFAAIAWRGISDHALGIMAAALLGVGVPLAYVVAAIIHDDEGLGGNSTDFGANRMAAHWMALAALVALALLLVRTLRGQRAPVEDQ
ncbi:MAG TPA: alpha-(1-_3)-arabinofuranosyltransferase family protein [Baekduia sp.]|nr:alpha-(1->3)-arabinofuranosyltransferase family protein [Baekduia sp.]